MALTGPKVVTADPPSETVKESRGELNQRETVMESCRLFFFGGRITRAYGPDRERAGYCSAARWGTRGTELIGTSSKTKLTCCNLERAEEEEVGSNGMMDWRRGERREVGGYVGGVVETAESVEIVVCSYFAPATGASSE